MVARDMGRLGVTCNAIRPNAGTRLSLSDEVKEAWTRAGMGQTITHMEQLRPEEVGPLVVWLASDEAANVNGRVFQIQTGKISLYSEPVEEETITTSGPWLVDDIFARLPPLTRHLANPPEPGRKAATV